MKTLTKILTALLACTSFASAVAQSGAAAPSAPPSIRFRWAIAAFNPDSKGAVPIRQNATISTNASVGMLVQLESACAVYVIIETADGDLEWHFPGNSPKELKTAEVGKAYYLPAPPMGLRLSTQPGTSRIYLLASAKPLVELEQSFTKYETATSNKNLAASDLLNLIKRMTQQAALQKRNSPVQLALRNDSDATDLKSIATEIIGDDFLARTILVRTR